jgi:hypothetical protein
MNILLNAITLAAKNKEVTIDDVVSSYNEGSETKYDVVKIGEKQIVASTQVQPKTYVNTITDNVTKAVPVETPKPQSQFNTIAILGSIGSFILALGTIVLIGNNWQTMSINQQLFASLGIGLALFYLSYFLSYRFKNNVISNIMIVISGLWLSWGLLFTVDKTVGDKSGKILVFGIILSVLAIIYGTLYRYFGKSLYFFAMSTVGFGSFMLIANYFLLNADSDQFPKIIALGVITAATSGLLVLAYHYRYLEHWVRTLLLLCEYSVFTISTYIFLVYLDRSWVRGSEQMAELAYSIFFGIWYWIAIKNQNKALLIINSLGFYYYILNISRRYNDNVAYTLILGGLGLIIISLVTYLVSKNMNNKKPSA